MVNESFLGYLIEPTFLKFLDVKKVFVNSNVKTWKALEITIFLQMDVTHVGKLVNSIERQVISLYERVKLFVFSKPQ